MEASTLGTTRTSDNAVGVAVTSEELDSPAGVKCAGDADNRFEFLSVFKWERRKGWDVLLEAYWRAFDKSDMVRLRLRTYVPPWDANTDSSIDALVEAFAQEKMGKSASELAQVIWEQGKDATLLSDSLSRPDIRDLLGSADAFVLPTRGEGWGLPIAEAMAMRVPTIVSACPGPSAYATEENAYLIPGAGDKGNQGGDASTDPLGFFIPDVRALAGLMRQVVHDSGPNGQKKALAKTARARDDMKSFSPERVASLMAERLRVAAMRRGWEF